MVTISATFALSLLLAVILTPLVRAFALRHRILDFPDADCKLHAKETPLWGGLAVFVATLATVCIVLVTGTVVGGVVAEHARDLIPLLVAAVIIMVMGLLDDVLHLRIRQKLLGQILAAMILIAWGLQIKNISILGANVELGLLAIPFTAIWMLFAINSLNFLDGADGFASTIGIVISATIGLIAVHRGHWVEAVVACSLAGSLVGFLIFNFPPSSIFLGDAGSMLIGLVVGMLAIYGHSMEATGIVLAAPVALLAIPFFDTTFAILRRLLTGRGVAIGDRAHIHHSIIRRGFGPRRLVVAAALLSLVTAAGAWISVVTGNEAYALCSIAILILILVGSRVFGFNELRLVANRAISIGESLIPRKRRSSTTWERKVGLVDSHHCKELWSRLTAFVEQHGLSRVCLDLKGSWMDDARDVLWEHITPQNAVENWRTSVPIFAQDRILGTIDFAGHVQGSSGQHLLVPLADLLESLKPTVVRLIDDSARQGVVLHTGYTKRVLFINRSYWPDCEATGQLLTELCEDLAQSFDVSVLAGQPNYVTNGDSYKTSGVQRRNDVEIYRVRHSRFSKRTMLGKACNLSSFTASAVWQSFFIPKHQIVVVETDPFLLALLGGMIKKWRGSQLVIYVQDVYPDVAIGIGKVRDGWVARSVRRRLLKAYELADRIVVLGEDMGSRLIRNGVNAEKIRCIPNWIDTNAVYPIKHKNAFRNAHGMDGKFVIMHSGNIGLTQELDQLIEVATRLRHREDILLVLVGDGASRPHLEKMASKLDLQNVRFMPYQARENLAVTLSAANLHVVSMHPDISGCLVPSKIYGIMASGTPMVAIVPEDTDVYRLVKEEKLGITISPGDLDALEDTIVRCANGEENLVEMGNRARKLAETRFDRRNSVGTFINLLDQYMHRKPVADAQVAGSTVATAAKSITVE